jgi:hypothetical protein
VNNQLTPIEEAATTGNGRRCLSTVRHYERTARSEPANRSTLTSLITAA